MGAFETNLVAISWDHGKYAVISQTVAHVDSAALERDGLLHDVSEGVGYVDEAKGRFHSFSRRAAYVLPVALPPAAFLVIGALLGLITRHVGLGPLNCLH